MSCPPERYRGAAAPGGGGNFSGKWLIMRVPADLLHRWFIEAAAAVAAGEFAAAKVGPARCFPPRHPHAFEPSFLELNGTL